MPLNSYYRLTYSSKTWDPFVHVNISYPVMAQALRNRLYQRKNFTSITLCSIQRENSEKVAISRSFQSSLAYPLIKCFPYTCFQISGRRAFARNVEKLVFYILDSVITSRTPLFYRSYLHWTSAPWFSKHVGYDFMQEHAGNRVFSFNHSFVLSFTCLFVCFPSVYILNIKRKNRNCRNLLLCQGLHHYTKRP